MSLIRDVRHAVRLLVRSPFVSALSVGAIALGIGITVAMFTVFNAVMLRPLPYGDAGQLVRVRADLPGIGQLAMPLSAPEYLHVRSNARAFQSVGAFRTAALTMSEVGAAALTPVRAILASDNLTEVLRTRPVIGRTFAETDAVEGAAPVVLISGELWRSRFGSDPRILDRAVEIDGAPHRIIGVLVERLAFPPVLGASAADVWMPLRLSPEERYRWGRRTLGVIARLADGKSVDQALHELTAMGAALALLHPETYKSDIKWRPSIVAVTVESAGSIGRTLPIMLGAVTLVLLIACANVAALLLAQGARRHREVVVRMALGAGRARIVRQFIAEGILLSALGGLVGACVSVAALRALLAVGTVSLPWLSQATVDWRVVAFIACLVLGCGVLFGLAPAALANNEHLSDALTSGGRSMTATRGHARMRGTLLFAETALAVLLLCGAGLLIRSFGNLMSVDLGFTPAGVWTMQMNTPQSRFRDSTASRNAFRRALHGMADAQGVESVSATHALPLIGEATSWDFHLEGRESGVGAPTTSEQVRVIAPQYFATMRIPVLAGRDIDFADEAGRPPVIVVNAAFARKYWPGRSALGKRISFSGTASGPIWSEVIGVVGDVRHDGVDLPPHPEYYIPLMQAPYDIRSVRLVVRATALDAAAQASLAEAVRAADPMQPRRAIVPMTQVVSDSVATRQFLMLCLSVFASVAFALAAFGIFGLTTIIVEQRFGEFGVRLALGAQPRDVIALVLRANLRVVGWGITIGVMGSLLATRLIASQLYGVGAVDPVTIAAVMVGMAGTAALASYFPARRTTSLDPLHLMRADGS